MRGAKVFASLGFWLLLLAAAPAAGYPDKPIRLVVPFPPGGALDLIARGLGPDLSAQLGQPIVIDNRPGANGAIGLGLVAKAPPDGYTLVLGFTTGVAVNPVLTKAPYDPVKDFSPVAMLARTPMVLVANPGFQAASVKELVALAKATPGKLSYGTPGNGNPNHLAGELFKSVAGVDLAHVPYKGAALVVTDVMAGHVPIAFVTLPAGLPHVRTGKLKALGITSDRRVSAAPEIPTLAEAGVAGVEIVEWCGVMAPAGTPAGVIARLNQEIVRAVNSPQLRERFVGQGFEPATGSIEAFAAAIRSDMEKSGRIIRQANIRAD